MNSAMNTAPAVVEHDARRVLDALQLLQLEFPEHEMVVDPILPKRGLAMLHGPRGLGKSHLALLLAFAAACAGKAVGPWSAPAIRNVFYVDGQMPAQDLKERLAALSGDGHRRAGRNLRFF